MFDNSSFKNNRKPEQDVNFIIKFLWVCAGANTKALKRAQANQAEYAMIGIGILIITILGMFSGGYFIYVSIGKSVEKPLAKLGISTVGGFLIGVTMGFLDSSVLSGIRKQDIPWYKEILKGGFILAKLGISVIISIVVSTPLQLKVFEPDINERLASINDEKYKKIVEQVNNNFENENKILLENKKRIEEELKAHRESKKGWEKASQLEGTRIAFGPKARELATKAEEETTKIEEKELKLQDIEDKINQLDEKKNTTLESRKKELQNAGFLNRLRAFSEIQREDNENEPIIEFGFIKMGNIQFFSWGITLLLIAVDNVGIVSKIFNPKSVYDELLEEEERLQAEHLKQQIQDDYEIEQEKLDLEKQIEQKKLEYKQQLRETQFKADNDIAEEKIKVDQDLITKQLEHQKLLNENYWEEYKKITTEAIAETFKNDNTIKKIKSQILQEYIASVQTKFPSGKVSYPDSSIFEEETFSNSSNHNFNDKQNNQHVNNNTKDNHQNGRNYQEFQPYKDSFKDDNYDFARNHNGEYLDNRNQSNHNNGNQNQTSKGSEGESNIKKFRFNVGENLAKIPKIPVGEIIKSLAKIKYSTLTKIEESQLSQPVQNLWRNKIFRYTVIVVGLISTALGGYLAYEWAEISRKYNKLQPIPFPKGITPRLVYASNGEIINHPYGFKTYFEKDLSDFSPHLINSLIASEDRRFYDHNGFDKKGFLRAIKQTLQGNPQGGSTLTQQLAKKLFLEENEDSLPLLRRKAQQILLAIKLEKKYSKEEILETYLNRIYIGNENYQDGKYGKKIHGFEQAAQFYFDKSAKDLDIAESATLVAILPAPNSTSSNPVHNANEAKKRRNARIDQMLELEKITEEQANQAKKLDVSVKLKNQNNKAQSTLAPYFYMKVYNELIDIVGQEQAQSGQYFLETTLDINYQRKAEQALNRHIETEGRKYNYEYGALATIDHRDSSILALVGGTGFSKNQYDLASKAERQLASTFKLFTYTAAIQKGISPEKRYSCQSFKWKTNGQQFPPCKKSPAFTSITMSKSLADSENSPALRIAKEVGFSKIADLAENMGIDINTKIEPQTVLGKQHSSLLDITNAYATIANQGILNQTYTIKTIRDRNQCQSKQDIKTCKVIYNVNDNSQTYPFPSKKTQTQVVAPDVANTVMGMLEGVVSYGTAKELKTISPNFSQFRIAGKTGTNGTNTGNTDLWFIGAVPEKKVVTGVWLGKCFQSVINDSESCNINPNSSQAVKLWGNYMKKVIN